VQQEVNLILTRDTELWPKNLRNSIAIGTWCMKDAKLEYANLPALVQYHWDDRNVLQKDFIYLKNLHAQILKKVTIFLNEFHGVSRTERFWEILVGPWILYFTQIAFDRWYMVDFCFRNYSISSTTTQHGTEFFPATSMEDFDQLMLDSAWNEYLFKCIVELRSSESLSNFTLEGANTGKPECKLPIRQSKARQLVRVILNISDKYFRGSKIFISASYLGTRRDLLLQLRMRQFPHIWETKHSLTIDFDQSQRNWQLPLESDEYPDFALLIGKLIPRFIPRAYLEGFTRLALETSRKNLPIRPNVIFTSNSYHSDEIFKYWAADKVENGSKYVIAQHGGGYGTHKFCATEDHQISTCDYYLSWGWGGGDNEKVLPGPMIKPLPKNQSPGFDKVLLVGICYPPQSYHLYSVPIGMGQWLEYFEDQLRFAKSLDANLKSKLFVRLYKNDFGYNQRERWLEEIPDIQFDSNHVDYVESIQNARAVVSTYNSTTFLESLAAGIPTIIFWNSKYFELRESAVPFFELLSDVGIFHETPESAADFLSRNLETIEIWWNSENVVKARNTFSWEFCRSTENLSFEISRKLREIALN
jgi:putative transferase (TIGR04331 family)